MVTGGAVAWVPGAPPPGRRYSFEWKYFECEENRDRFHLDIVATAADRTTLAPYPGTVMNYGLAATE